MSRQQDWVTERKDTPMNECNYYGDPLKTQAYVDIMHRMSIYQIGLDESDFGVLGTAFAKDAVLELADDVKLSGRVNVCESLASRRRRRMQHIDASKVFQSHNLTTRLIEVSGSDAASCRISPLPPRSDGITACDIATTLPCIMIGG